MLVLVGSCSLARARCRVLLGVALARWTLELEGETDCVQTNGSQHGSKVERSRQMRCAHASAG